MKSYFSENVINGFFKVFIVLNIILMVVACLKPANENFSFYNFIYSNYHNQEVNLYSSSGNPYLLVGLPVDYFKPGKLTVIDLKNDSALQYKAGDKKVNLYLEKGFSADTSSFLAGKKSKLVYRNIPEWITHFNFNNWLKRANAWQVYELQ